MLGLVTSLVEKFQKKKGATEGRPLAEFLLNHENLLVTSANKAALNLFGVSEGNILLGRSRSDLLDPSDAARLETQINAVRNGEQPAPILY